MRGELNWEKKQKQAKKKEKREVADEGRRNDTKCNQLHRVVSIISLVCNAVPWTLFYNTLQQRLPYIVPGYQRSRCASVNWIPNLPLRSEACPRGDSFEEPNNKASRACWISRCIILWLTGKSKTSVAVWNIEAAHLYRATLWHGQWHVAARLVQQSFCWFKTE